MTMLRRRLELTEDKDFRKEQKTNKTWILIKGWPCCENDDNAVEEHVIKKGAIKWDFPGPPQEKIMPKAW